MCQLPPLGSVRLERILPDLLDLLQRKYPQLHQFGELICYRGPKKQEIICIYGDVQPGIVEFPHLMSRKTRSIAVGLTY